MSNVLASPAMTFYHDIIRNDVILLLKIDPTLIMLNGRWKSDAIFRYIRTDIISPEIITLALHIARYIPILSNYINIR